MGGSQARRHDVNRIAETAKGRPTDRPFCNGFRPPAEREGAHYTLFGPVLATPSKLQYGPAQGVARLAEICRAVRIPVLAIGGITLDNAQDCLRADAAGIAGFRLFQECEDLPRMVKLLHGHSSEIF